MIDQIFGKLTVIAAAGKNNQNRLLWLCRCACGNEVVVRSDALRGKRPQQSCGRCFLTKIVPGGQFGRWTAIEEVGIDRHGNHLWRCKCVCVCGNEGVVYARHLREGKSQSCGCLQRESASKLGKSKRRHGHRSGTQSRAYTAWINMKERCNNPNRSQWKDWGGRGIIYTAHWDIFENFLDDMGEPPGGMSLDRIDNDGNYCKENCRWTDCATQRRNSRQTWHVVDADGEILVLKDYAAKHNLPYTTILSRLFRGSSLEEALKFR